MGNSFRVTIRFNPEYDQDIINNMKQYNNRNLSKILRKFIREGFKSNALSAEKSDITIQKTKKVVKWNFPS